MHPYLAFADIDQIVKVLRSIKWNILWLVEQDLLEVTWLIY
jgi:hypothetical protein